MKVKSYPYRKGIKLPKIKSFISNEEPKVLSAPKLVYISVKQVKGLTPKAVVVGGDKVKIGTVVAVSGNNSVYSTVSGKVVEIVKRPSVYGGVCDTIVIENDFKDEKELFFNPQELSADKFFDVIKKANIVDYDGVSLYSKLFNTKNINTLVINAVTDEPFEKLSLEIIKRNFDRIIEGVKIVQKVINAGKVVFAISKDYFKEVKTIINGSSDIENAQVALLPNLYPVGDDDELYMALTKKVLNKNERAIDKGFVIIDVYTLFMVGELIQTGLCDNKRLLGIYDMANKNPVLVNVWATVGTDIKEIIEEVRENKLIGIRKVIAGGPMRGIALGDGLAPVTKGLKSIIILGDELEEQPKEINCISCGKCKEVCPKYLSPRDIDLATENQDMVTAKNLGAEFCTKCGCCSFVCPSKRHLTQRISYAKEFIKDKGM